MKGIVTFQGKKKRVILLPRETGGTLWDYFHWFALVAFVLKELLYLEQIHQKEDGIEDISSFYVFICFSNFKQKKACCLWMLAP